VLFFLRGVAPPEVTTADTSRGMVPFVRMQVLALVFFFPALATWLPKAIGWEWIDSAANSLRHPEVRAKRTSKG
jgi:hypothetical protein